MYNSYITLVYLMVCIANTVSQADGQCQDILNHELDFVSDSKSNTVQDFGADRSVLDTQEVTEDGVLLGGGWVAGYVRRSPYITFKLSERSNVTGITTQGRNCDSCEEYTRRLVISYSDDGEEWYCVRTPDTFECQPFDANTDQDTQVTNLFDEPFEANYVRVQPLRWTGDRPALRVGILGCAGPYDIEEEDDATDDICVDDCTGLDDGDYQSCNGCTVYVSCVGEYIYDNRPCPGGLFWDDSVKRCEYESTTCDVTIRELRELIEEILDED